MSNKSDYAKPSQEELRRRLTPIQYEVTQASATEPPFHNPFWNEHAAGLYVDVTTGEPLFSSTDKFDSGTGWPSFVKPVEAGRVVEVSDVSHGMTRVEVRSRAGSAHLGHVFDDGPAPTGLRYCINSASLKFIAASELERAGYSAYRGLFAGAAAPPVVATDNSCARPAPGQRVGCETTFETAVIAGGCFWGMEELLRQIPGVVETEVGFAGGTTAHPTYNDVKHGDTGHAEAVRVVFDPSKLSYADLLEWFFRMHDPTTANRQGNDVGTQYRSAIFVQNAAQKRVAEEIVAKINRSGKWKKPIATQLTTAQEFTPAEEFHQKYLVKNPGGYTCHYLRE